MPKFQDLTGRIFGDYKVVRRVEDRIQPSGKKEVQYALKCINCGYEAIRAARNLKVCAQNKCSVCLEKERDITGQIFGHWFVIERAENLPGGSSQWLCRCTRCGKTESVIPKSNLVRGKSSGCLKCLHITHGDAGSKLYGVWHGMWERTTNPNTKNYKNYGGRGIKVCDEWKDYTKFKDWAINNGYSENLSIDRIDNDGNYEPSNCRWADRVVQNYNQRRVRSTPFVGVKKVESGNGCVYRSHINSSKRNVYLGTHKTDSEAALARDLYLLENNLLEEHHGNFITHEKLGYKEK